MIADFRNATAKLTAVLTAAVAVLAVAPASPATGAGCSEPTTAFTAAFDSLPDTLRVVPVCPTDVGPGIADPETSAQFSALTAGDVTDTISTTDELILGALVGTLKDGGGEAFVDGLFARLGPEARGGTVTLDGKLVQYINIPGGPSGYAYGAGPNVVIGYVKAPADDPWNNLGAASARQAYTRVLAAATGAPLPNIPPPANDLDQWPLARGDYTTSADPGWVYFGTPLRKSGVYHYYCGIAPGGTMAGCDYVPASKAPEGTNQTIVDSSGARYIHSDTQTFTRDVDDLRAGERLEVGPAACGMNYQGTVTCRIGEHMFVTNGVLD